VEQLKKSTAINLEYSSEFTYDIALDNLKTVELKNNHLFGEHITPTHLNSTRHSIQIASKMVCI